MDTNKIVFESSNRVGEGILGADGGRWLPRTASFYRRSEQSMNMFIQEIKSFGRREAVLFLAGVLTAIGVFSYGASSQSNSTFQSVTETRHFDTPIARPQRSV